MSTCALLGLPEDVLCSLAIPDCRVLLMARTCKRMHAALTARASPVHITVRKQVLKDARLAKLFASGMLEMQALFQIRHFECIARFSAARCVELNLCDFEDLTFLHLRHFKMHNNQLREMHLANLLHMLTFSHDLRTFEFTQQSLLARHAPALAYAISRFPLLGPGIRNQPFPRVLHAEHAHRDFAVVKRLNAVTPDVRQQLRAQCILA
jgi:hypothetical protein